MIKRLIEKSDGRLLTTVTGSIVFDIAVVWVEQGRNVDNTIERLPFFAAEPEESSLQAKLSYVGSSNGPGKEEIRQ